MSVKTLAASIEVLIAAALLLTACGRTEQVPVTVSAPTLPEITTSTPAATTTPRIDPTLPPPPPSGLCESYADPIATGTVTTRAVTEASGIATSRTHPETIWMHNDSGGGAVVHATDFEGSELGSFEINASAFDWEDMAIGPGPITGTDYLYVGDIGDNLHFRPAVTVYRFAEPAPDPRGGSVTEVERLELVYPQPGFDSEALLVDPVSGDLLIVTKGAAGGDPSHIFRASADQLSDGAVVDLEQIGTFAMEAGAFVTAADIDPTGSAIVFRGYNEVWLWERVDLDFSATFAAAPCRTPSTAEVQGEAIAFATDDFSYFTVSEGGLPDINYVASNLP